MLVQPNPVGGSSLEYFQKIWPAEFSKDRNPLEEKSLVEYTLDAASTTVFDPLPNGEHLPTDPAKQKPIDADPPESALKDEPNRLELFLRGYDDDDPSNEEEEITDFCRGVHPSILRQPGGGQRRAAWLDDRSYSFYCNPAKPHSSVQNLEALASKAPAPPGNDSPLSPEATSDDTSPEDGTSHNSTTQSANKGLPYRMYEPPLSASALFESLKEKQFGHSKLPDVDRRLISISNLSPSFIFALTETALPHQAPSLKETISNHLALQTSISVNISTGNYTVFQMQFHMPFYALRKGRQKEYFKDEVFIKPRRTWRDVSSLVNDRPTTHDKTPLGIHEAHIAVTICGVADRRWVAYAFSDTDFDEDKDMGEYEFDYNGMVVDQIAADGARAVNANHPTWNPREYFLLIVSRRLDQIVSEWAKLIRKFEIGIRKDTEKPPSVKTPSLGPEVNEDTFDRMQKTLIILWELRDALATTNEEWKRFCSADGDIGYFRDFENVPEVSKKDGQGLCPMILEIKAKFDKLAVSQRRLNTLVERCQNRADILGLGLMLESNKVAKLSGFNAKLMVVWISPFAIVSAFFAIPEPFGGFHRTGPSFAAAIIIVFVVLRFLMSFEEGRIRPRYFWQKVKDSKAKFQPRNLQVRERLRRRRLFRADTEATLCGS